MKFNAALDVSVVAHETADEVAVLLDVQAPPAVPDATRATGSLQVVLDRSGSMAGPPLEGAVQALVDLVTRLEPTDNFGLVTFDDTAQVVVPAGPLVDKAATIASIRAVESGGMTDLSAGYLRGLRELRRAAGESGGTVLVVSDGHVNQGIGDPDRFAEVARKAAAARVVTSTLGYGLGYDETLLAAIARAGSGNHVFADDPDAAGAAIAREVDGLVEKVVQAATLTIGCGPQVQVLRLYNDLPVAEVGPGRLMVELGDFYEDEARRLLLTLDVPALAALGLAQVAELQLAYVELPALVEHTVTLPITVNVVPGDEAARRVADPSVVSERLFQEAQATKRRASEAFERGEADTGLLLLGQVRASLSEAGLLASPDVAAGIAAEQADVDRMSLMTPDAGAAYMSKVTRASYHRQNRQRGRRDES